MGFPIAWIDSIPLGDHLWTISPRGERIGAGVIPVYNSPAALLPNESKNWRWIYTAIFSHAENGSGMAGQEALHEHFEALMALLAESATAGHTIAWIQDDSVSAVVGASYSSPHSGPLIVDDNAGFANGDLVYFSGGAYGWLTGVSSDGPEERIDVASISADVAEDETVFKAWRVYSNCRVLTWDPGLPEENSMDGFRHSMRLRFDTPDLTSKPIAV